jgi:hypothetical protein
MPEYTERVSEVMYPLVSEYADLFGSGITRSAWVSMENYHRGWLYLNVGSVGTDYTLDVYLQQATTVGGLGGKAITGKAITQLDTNDDDSLICIELQTEEMDVSNNFDFVAVVMDIRYSAQNGTGVELAWTFFGCVPRYAATPTTNWQEIVG